MLKKLLIISIVFLLNACGEDKGDMTSTEIQKEDEMFLFTYTWTHPKCPFTVTFPGIPEVEELIDTKGTKTISLTIGNSSIAYFFDCDINILDTIDDKGSYTDYQLAEYYSQLLNYDAANSNVVTTQIDKSEGIYQNGAILKLTMNRVEVDRILNYESYVFLNDNTMAMANFIYDPTENFNLKLQGIDFIKGIVLNP